MAAASAEPLESVRQFEDTFRYALQEGHTVVMETLLRDHKVPLPADAHTLAARSKRAAAVYAFLREHRGVAWPPQQLAESLEASVKSGDTEGVALLLRWGADPTAPNLLVSAARAEFCNAPLMSLLLEAKADPLAHNRQAERAIFPLLRNYYAYDDEYPRRLAEERFARANECLRLLLRQSGVSPNARLSGGGTGPTALDEAMEYNWGVEATTILLDAGAEPSLPALRRAIQRGRLATVEAFVKTARGAAALGGAADNLLREAVTRSATSVTALLFHRCPAAGLSHTAWRALLELPEFHHSADLLHAALLYYHRSFPEQPLPEVDAAPYYPVLRAAYQHTEDGATSARLLDWHQRCPHGLDAAAQRLLTAVDAPVAQMEEWLARHRSTALPAASVCITITMPPNE